MTRSTTLKQALKAWMDVAMQRSMRGWAQHARSLGLSLPQFSILMQLHHHGQCGVSDISERFGISTAAASQHVENLVQAGFLERTQSLQDRRVRSIELTGTGRELLARGMAQRHAWIDALSGQFDESTSQVIAAALVELTKAARALEHDVMQEHRTAPG